MLNKYAIVCHVVKHKSMACIFLLCTYCFIFQPKPTCVLLLNKLSSPQNVFCILTPFTYILQSCYNNQWSLCSVTKRKQIKCDYDPEYLDRMRIIVRSDHTRTVGPYEYTRTVQYELIIHVVGSYGLNLNKPYHNLYF